MNNPFYQEHDFEDEAYDEGMAYGRGYRRISNPNSGGGFSFLIMIGEEITQVLIVGPKAHRSSFDDD